MTNLLLRLFVRDYQDSKQPRVRSKVGKLSGKIILTGGGVVKDRRNYAPLHQNGRIYHLWRELNVLPVEGRPISQRSSAEALWAERKPLYEAFRDALVDNNGTVELARDYPHNIVENKYNIEQTYLVAQTLCQGKGGTEFVHAKSESLTFLDAQFLLQLPHGGGDAGLGKQ